MVQSARVQQLVKGDDVTLTHQVMKDVAYNAEKSRVPVVINEDDTAKVFYEREDGLVFGYDAVIESGSSVITVAIPGTVPAVDDVPVNGTSTFISGPAQTVRIEVTRDDDTLETYYCIAELDVFERGFPASLADTSGGSNPPPANLNLP